MTVQESSRISILSRASSIDVIEEPFPYIVIHDALDEDLCDRLRAEYPPLDSFPRWSGAAPHNWGGDMSNRRLDIPVHEVLKGIYVSEAWRTILLNHVTREFLLDFARVFEPAILRLFPDFEKNHRGLKDMRVGIQGVDDPDSTDILLSASVSGNSPVLDKPSRVRGPHIDRAGELFAGLLYLRHPEDRSEGGEFEIYRFNRYRGYMKNEVLPNYVHKVATVPYKHNTLTMLINSLDSLHGVSEREVTPYPRQFLIVSGALPTPLIDNSKYQIGPKPRGARGAVEDVAVPPRLQARLDRLLRR